MHYDLHLIYFIQLLMGPFILKTSIKVNNTFCKPLSLFDCYLYCFVLNRNKSGHDLIDNDNEERCYTG